ncbi:hypothetical protein [Nocardia sp. NPDC051570]|uniref:hypothetical protein n=1 Tax=Nocardia sp. NPDC051570 TaxID=3364324 RepID=UPI0037BA817B
MGSRRYVFLSASFLSKQYKAIPSDMLENSILFFGAKRSWLFPTNREEMLDARNQPVKYLEFDEDYKSLVLHKEQQKLAYWLLPDKDYQSASQFFQGVTDPVIEGNYSPLILDEAWWRTDFQPTQAKYTGDVQAIVTNFKNGAFGYDEVMELLYQSNPTVVPTLYWTED